jgi:hypothetical protein
MNQTAKSDDWPFADPRNMATFTVRQIVRDHHPIHRVAHERNDGAWQFLEWETPCEEDAMVVSLEGMTWIDPSMCEFADLPLGWRAVRLSPAEPWHREPNPNDGN